MCRNFIIESALECAITTYNNLTLSLSLRQEAADTIDAYFDPSRTRHPDYNLRLVRIENSAGLSYLEWLIQSLGSVSWTRDDSVHAWRSNEEPTS